MPAAGLVPVLRSVQVLDPLDDPALVPELPELRSVLPWLRSVRPLDPLDDPALVPELCGVLG